MFNNCVISRNGCCFSGSFYRKKPSCVEFFHLAAFKGHSSIRGGKGALMSPFYG